MPSREELLQSIRPEMKLTKDFFKRIYGYEITCPGFAAQALDRLEIIAGCSRAREHYNNVVNESDQYYEEGIKDAAAWYIKEYEKKWNQEGSEERRKEQIMKSLEKMSDRELLKLWQQQKQLKEVAF